MMVPKREKKLLEVSVLVVRGRGCWGGGVLRKVGGVLVDVGGQEVLHGCCIEHDGAGEVDVGTSMEAILVIDVAEYTRWCDSGEMEVDNFDTGCKGLLLLDPRTPIQN